MEEEYYHTKESVEEYIRLAKDVSGIELIVKFKEFLPLKSSVLEIGSGPGTDWKILNNSYHVIGSDNSQEFLDHLYSIYPEGEFVRLDASTLLINDKFNGIYSNKVLHHLGDNELKASFERQSKILNTQGIICHSFWKGEGSEIFKGLMVNYHSTKSLMEFYEPHFEILLMEDYKEFEDGDSILVIAQKKK